MANAIHSQDQINYGYLVMFMDFFLHISFFAYVQFFLAKCEGQRYYTLRAGRVGLCDETKASYGF